jgi:catechol 2,3-dioxygenase-like lactoylglutathione lyase family enzyme
MSHSIASKNIVATAGEAVGKITGINHIVLHARDLDESIRFYRDILGLKIVRTQRFSPKAMGSQNSADLKGGGLGQKGSEAETVAQIFFEMGNKEYFSLYAGPTVDTHPQTSIVPFLWPEGSTEVPNRPTKMDHLSFDVATREDVIWFQNHLQKHGIPVSDVIDRQGTHRFVISIYFNDPSGNPLEIATLDRANPAWHGYDFSTWLRDETPPPSLYKASV